MRTSDFYPKQNNQISGNLFIPNYSAVKPALNDPKINNQVVYDDMQVAIGVIRPGASAPTWKAYRGSELLAFDKNQNNKASFNIQYSHRIRVGSETELHIHTVAPDNNAGVVLWRLTVSYANINGTFGEESSIDFEQTINAQQNEHILTSIKNPFTENAGISSFAICSLTRVGTDAKDTYDNDIYLLGIDSHFKVDTMGSRRMMSK